MPQQNEMSTDESLVTAFLDICDMVVDGGFALDLAERGRNAHSLDVLYDNGLIRNIGSPKTIVESDGRYRIIRIGLTQRGQEAYALASKRHDEYLADVASILT